MTACLIPHTRSFFNPFTLGGLFRPDKLDESLFLTYETEFVLFNAAGKFCLALALGQITRNVKSHVRNLNFRSNVICPPPLKKHPTMFGKGRYAT